MQRMRSGLLALPALLFILGASSGALAISCGTGASCSQYTGNTFSLTGSNGVTSSVSISGATVLDAWDITKATDGPTNHFFDDMGLTSVQTGLGQLYSQLGDPYFHNLTGATDTDLGGISGATGSGGGTFSLSSLGASIWGIHWDNHFLALVLTSATSSLTIAGLPQAISGVYAFNLESLAPSPVPLPPAVLLFGSGLVGLILLYRRRKKRGQAAFGQWRPSPVS